MNCDKCGSNIPEGAQFCANCAATVEAPAPDAEKTAVYEPIKSEPEQSVQSEAPKKAKKSKKGLIIGIISAVLVLLAAAAAVLFFVFKNNNKEIKTPLVYYTENKLYATQQVKENHEAFEVCTDYAGDYKITSDNKYIFYTQNLQEHGTEEEGLYYTSDLYYRELFSKKSEPILLAKAISKLSAVSDVFDSVYYEKDGAIYKTNRQLKTNKLLDNAYVIEINETSSKMLVASDAVNDGKSLSESEVNMIDLNTNKVYEISSKALNYAWASDLSKVYFVENGALYCSDAIGNSQKISEKNNVNEFYYCEDCVYYTVLDKTFTYSDLVDYPEKEADEKLTEPKFEDFAPKQEEYIKKETDDVTKQQISVLDAEAFEKAQQKATEDYDKASTEYLRAQNRINTNEMLEEAGDTALQSYSLYMYNGANKKICSNVSTIAPINNTKNKGCGKALVYTYNTPVDKLAKLEILDVKKVEDITNYIKQQVVFDQSIASYEKLTFFYTDSTSYHTYVIAYDENADVYLASGKKRESDEKCDLYIFNEGQSFNQAEVIANDCSNYFYINGKIAYLNEYNEKTASFTLHYDGGKINDMSGQVLIPEYEDGSFYYATGYNQKTNLSTVYKYKDKKVQKVAENVMFTYSTFGTYDGNYLYLTDYNTNDFCGTLICQGEEGKFEVATKIRGIDNVNILFTGQYE